MTEQKQTTTDLTQCIHGSKITPCNELCPFELDVRDIMAKIKKGSFIGAYNLYREAVLFPEIACRLCPAPCREKCASTIGGNGVDIKGLERFLTELFLEKDPASFGGIIESKKIAVIGSGLSGMAAALKFSQAGYAVTVFEEGGTLCPEIAERFGEELVSHGILRQFKYSSCEFVTGVAPASVDTSAFDFIVNASNTELPGDKIFRVQPGSYAVNSITAGKNIYRQLDWYIKTGNLKEIEPLKTEVFSAEEKDEAPEVQIDKPAARAMAGECTGCDCSKCMEACAMLKDYGSDIIDLNRAIGMTLNLFEHVDTREGTRQISGCTDCGLCKEICPKGIDIGAFLIETKKTLFKQGVIPHAYHDYWLRDYAFAESEKAFLFHMPKEGSSGYMFFPGCQTGASDPRYVSMSYELLLSRYPDTSLLLGCCGAPIKWTGDDEGMEKAHEKIRQYWEKAGRPVIVTVCPSCHKILKNSIDDAKVVMLYDVIDVPEKKELPFESAAVFDPCSSRDYPEMQLKVREMAKAAGFRLEESRYHGKETQCCSYGNQVYDVNRNMVEKQVKERMGDSELPYIVYCTNCRDIFASRGKSVRHILDVILGINGEERGVPTLQQRRTNRYELKKALTEKYGIENDQGDIAGLADMTIDEKLQKKMDDNLILTEDVSSVIENAEKSGAYLVDPESGHRIAHELRGIITYWAEYLPEDGGYRVFNVYSHRINIKGDVSAV
ncbi:MAG: 4Fe-4S dicluster domain-containing protein [Firmicutes bacterium]|nr:4Fe-4S dicluster domain-containing protein [Bacillota bacterium]